MQPVAWLAFPNDNTGQIPAGVAALLISPLLLPVVAFTDETMSTEIAKKKTKSKKSPNGIALSIAVQHGEKHFVRFSLSGLPKGSAHLKRHVNPIRELFEQECIARHGRITGTMAAAIQTAVRWEEKAKFAEKIIRAHWDEFDPQTQVDLLEKVGKFSERRDAALRSLDLDSEATKQRKALDVMFEPTPPEEAPADES